MESILTFFIFWKSLYIVCIIPSLKSSLSLPEAIRDILLISFLIKNQLF